VQTPIIQKIKMNQSPVNFFDPDYEKYPYFMDIDRKYTVILHEGDCLYIPAYYWHHYLGKQTPPPAP
jgi:ribosomal protein L16 Arg81 hydroxylase